MGDSTEYEVVPIRGIRGLIAKSMQASLQQAAQLTLEAEADASALVALRTRLQAADMPVAYDDLLVRAVALALRNHPRLNGLIVGDEVRLYRAINVGLAIALPEGLVAPAIFDADAKSLEEIMRAREDLVARARATALTVAEMTSGTFTITNLGLYRVDHFTPVINPPQIAILGVGRIARRPFARSDDTVSVRSTVALSLTFDHRAVDGAPAAAFLQEVCTLLEEGERGPVGLGLPSLVPATEAV